jgi:Cupin superfamily protein
VSYVTTPAIETSRTAPQPPTAVDWPSVVDFHPAKITRFRHNLDREPLLDVSSLRGAAKRLHAKGQVKFKPAKAGGVKDLFLTENSHAAGYSIDEVFDRIDDPASWLAIYQLNEDPAYASMCQRLLAEIDEHLGAEDPGMYGPDLAIFLSSPPAFTPYHIDQHPVFFFQVRGKKRLNLWDSHDPDVLPPHLTEQFLCWKTEGLIKYRDELQKKAIEIELGPGDGVYWPATTPHLTHTESHWVTPGDGFSLSFNISYYTNATRRRVCISALNQLLRKLPAARPHPFGESDLRDRVKYPLGRAFLRVRRMLKGGYLRPEQGV